MKLKHKLTNLKILQASAELGTAQPQLVSKYFQLMYSNMGPSLISMGGGGYQIPPPGMGHPLGDKNIEIGVWWWVVLESHFIVQHNLSRTLKYPFIVFEISQTFCRYIFTPKQDSLKQILREYFIAILPDKMW